MLLCCEIPQVTLLGWRLVLHASLTTKMICSLNRCHCSDSSATIWLNQLRMIIISIWSSGILIVLAEVLDRASFSVGSQLLHSLTKKEVQLLKWRSMTPYGQIGEWLKIQSDDINPKCCDLSPEDWWQWHPLYLSSFRWSNDIWLRWRNEWWRKANEAQAPEWLGIGGWSRIQTKRVLNIYLVHRLLAVRLWSSRAHSWT